MSKANLETLAYWALTAWFFAGIVSFLLLFNAGLALVPFFRTLLAAVCLAFGIVAMIWLLRSPRGEEEMSAQPPFRRALVLLGGPLLVAALSWSNLLLLLYQGHALAGTESRATLTVSSRGIASRPSTSSCAHYVRFEETAFPYKLCVTAEVHVGIRAQSLAQAEVKRSPLGFSIEAVQLPAGTAAKR